MRVIALDLSVSSPGVALVNTDTKQIELYCFQTRKRETPGRRELVGTAGVVGVTVLPPIPEPGCVAPRSQDDAQGTVKGAKGATKGAGSVAKPKPKSKRKRKRTTEQAVADLASDYARYNHIATAVLKLVIKHSPESIVLEDYAFTANDNAHASKLRELGGIVKYVVSSWAARDVKRRRREREIQDDDNKEQDDSTVEPALIYPIAIGSWKKLAIGNGHAKKHQLVTGVCQRLGITPEALFTSLGFPSGRAAVYLENVTEGTPVVPTPVQDLCDAAGIALAVCCPLAVPTKKKTKKKPKKTKKTKKTMEAVSPAAVPVTTTTTAM